MIELAAFCILLVILFIAMDGGGEDPFMRPAPGLDEEKEK